jgi:hypothetical protein
MQSTINLVAHTRYELDYVALKSDNVKDEVVSLKKKYESTLGALNDRIKKINERDENEKTSGDNPFYG